MASYSKSDIVWIVIIVVLIILNSLILYNGLTLDCDKCTIAFKNTKIAGVVMDPPILVAEVKAQDLYDKFIDGKCMIKFDRVYGYYLAGDYS